jgi:hypothetical protein
VTIRTRLKRLERLTPPVPPKPQEPLAQFLERREVIAAFKQDAEFVAAHLAVYRILCEALEREGERPPADFLPGGPEAALAAAQQRRKLDPDTRAWIEECRPEAERIYMWMERTPGFDHVTWLRERRPDYLPAMLLLATAQQAVLLKRFGRRTRVVTPAGW